MNPARRPSIEKILRLSSDWSKSSQDINIGTDIGEAWKAVSPTFHLAKPLQSFFGSRPWSFCVDLPRRRSALVRLLHSNLLVRSAAGYKF